MMPMSPAIRLAVIFGVFIAIPPAQQITSQMPATSGARPPEKITVKIRDGKSGLPIWLASPYVFVGKTDPQKFKDSYRRTKLWGDAHVDVSGSDPREVKVWVDFIHRDCRFPDGSQPYRTFDFAGNTLKGIDVYDIDKVLREGVVAPNLCSAKTQQPEPGVLTIYVLPATFKELWDS